MKKLVNCSTKVLRWNFCILFLLLLFPLSSVAQEKVKGMIKDAIGEPLTGVNIAQKGTNQGTMSDIDGNYELILNGKNATLIFSYIGYQTKEMSVSGKSELNVVLLEDNQLLDEVVVIGYGTAKKRDLTGAISSIRTDKLAAEAPRSVQDLMRANTAGLSIGFSADAKGDAGLQIRGKNSLKASTSPLIVLDGVIYEGAMTDINPIDIESIDVLKDASSAAVYGAKSANGVVVINTKRGKSGKPVITFNANLGLATLSKKQEILDAEGFLDYRYDYEIGRRTDEYHQQYPNMFSDPRKLNGVSQLDWYNYDQKTPVSSVTEEMLLRSWLSRLDLKGPEIDNYLSGRTTDWSDLVFQNGFQQDYTASISNSNENVSYYWSMGYADREGVVVGDKYTTFRTRLNLESTINKWMKIGVNSSFSSRNEGYMSCDWGQMVAISPYGANEMDNPEAPEDLKKYPTSDRTPQNPFYDNSYRDRRKYLNNLNANIYAQIKLPLDITYKLNFIPRYQWYEYYNHDSSKNIDWKAKGGFSTRETEKIFSWQLDNLFTWQKEFNKIHNVEATFLINAEKFQSWKQTATASNFSPSDVLGWHRLQAGTVPLNTSNDEYQTGDALMGRLFYSLKNRYLLTASIRRDGYSAFGQENPRATFPALALGWIFTSEKFMQSSSTWLNYGKLRFSWGENGNRSIGRYEAMSDMNSGSHPYIDLSGNIYISSQLYVNRMANKGLKWERTGSYNFGLDFAFLKERLTGSLEGYFSTTNDLLVDRALPEIIGFNSVAANLGQIANKGFEFTLNADLIRSKDFNWNASANLSFNRRKIKKLYGDMVNVFDESGLIIGEKEADDIKNKWFIGQDPDRIWDYERVGVWQVEEAEEAKKYGLQPGDFKYVDQNGDGVMTNDDKVFQGYKTPRFRWTLRNEFVYRDLSLSFMLYSYWGQYDTFNRSANASNFADRCSEYVQPHWMPENRENDWARIGSKNIGNVYVAKSFIRLDNITVSYNVPAQFLKKFSVQNMRLSGSIRNVGVFFPHWNFWDPENSGPSPRTYNISLNFTL